MSIVFENDRFNFWLGMLLGGWDFKMATKQIFDGFLEFPKTTGKRKNRF